MFFHAGTTSAKKHPEGKLTLPVHECPHEHCCYDWRIVHPKNFAYANVSVHESDDDNARPSVTHPIPSLREISGFRWGIYEPHVDGFTGKGASHRETTEYPSSCKNEEHHSKRASKTVHTALVHAVFPGSLDARLLIRLIRDGRTREQPYTPYQPIGDAEGGQGCAPPDPRLV